MKTALWTILVPASWSDGEPIHTGIHELWDSQVREITNGLTVFQPTRGQWVSPDKEVFIERMIPVNIMCTEDQIKQISDLTAKYYEQQAIMFWKVTDDVRIIHY